MQFIKRIIKSMNGEPVLPGDVVYKTRLYTHTLSHIFRRYQKGRK